MPKLWFAGAAALLGILLVVSIIVVLLEKEEPLPEGTPEAAVQSFLGAIEAEEFQAAHSFLSDDLREECPVERFFGDPFPRGSEIKDARITLEQTSMLNDTAFVTVRISQFGGSGPFGASEFSYEQRYTLRQQDGEWRFTEFPWPLFRCGPFEAVAPKIEATPTPEPTATSTPDPLREGE